ncbi:MAG: mandelate racemase/muconate lactonizing enzyme family protein [Candidatus Parvarchaeota archaeon]
MQELKITNVETLILEVPISKMETPPESLPYYQELKSIVFDSYKSVLVKVTGENGITGIGESMTRLSSKALKSIIDDVLKPVIMGKNAFDYELLWEEMYSTMRQRGHYKGYMIEAISGVDIAIWDLMGKTLHLPIYSLLGGKFRDQLKCYASSVRFRKPEDVVNDVKNIINEGFDQVKLKVGRGVEEDALAVKLLRDTYGYDLTIMVDANSGYNINSALKVGKIFEKYEVFWFEEPISPDNIPGYRLLSQKLDIPIAAGESEFTKFGFRDLITLGNIGIIQPNVGRSGGFTEVRNILAFARAYGIPYAPHTGSSSAITMAAEVHLAAYAPNFLTYEYMRTPWSHEQPNPLRNEILKKNLDEPLNGRINVPAVEGLGVELNEEAVKKYRVG